MEALIRVVPVYDSDVERNHARIDGHSGYRYPVKEPVQTGNMVLVFDREFWGKYRGSM